MESDSFDYIHQENHQYGNGTTARDSAYGTNSSQPGVRQRREIRSSRYQQIGGRQNYSPRFGRRGDPGSYQDDMEYRVEEYEGGGREGRRRGYRDGYSGRNHEVSWSDEEIINDYYPDEIIHHESVSTTRADGRGMDRRQGRIGDETDVENQKGVKKYNFTFSGKWRDLPGEIFAREYFGINGSGVRNSEIEESSYETTRYRPTGAIRDGNKDWSLHRSIEAERSHQALTAAPERRALKSGKENRARFADEDTTHRRHTSRSTERIKYRRPTRKKGFERKTAWFFEDMVADAFGLFGGKKSRSKSQTDIRTRSSQNRALMDREEHYDKSLVARGRDNIAARDYRDGDSYARRTYRSTNVSQTRQAKPTITGNFLVRFRSDGNLDGSRSRETVRSEARRTAFSPPVSPTSRLRMAQKRSMSYDTGLDQGVQTMQSSVRSVGTSTMPRAHSSTHIQTDIPIAVKQQELTPPAQEPAKNQVLNFFLLGQDLEPVAPEEFARRVTSSVQATPRQPVVEPVRRQEVRPVSARREVPIIRQPPPVRRYQPLSETQQTSFLMKPKISESRSYEMESNTPTPAVREEISVPVFPQEKPIRQISRIPETREIPPTPPPEEEEEVILESSSIEEKEQRIRMQIREDVEFSMLRTQGGNPTPQIEGVDGFQRAVEPWWIPEKFEAVVDRRKQKSTQIEQMESDGDFRKEKETTDPRGHHEIRSQASSSKQPIALGWHSSDVFTPGIKSSSSSYSKQYHISGSPLNDNDIVVEKAVNGNDFMENRMPISVHEETSRESVASYSGPDVLSETEGARKMKKWSRSGGRDRFGDLPEQFYHYGTGDSGFDDLVSAASALGDRASWYRYETKSTAL